MGRTQAQDSLPVSEQRPPRFDDGPRERRLSPASDDGSAEGRDREAGNEEDRGPGTPGGGREIPVGALGRHAETGGPGAGACHRSPDRPLRRTDNRAGPHPEEHDPEHDHPLQEEIRLYGHHDKPRHPRCVLHLRPGHHPLGGKRWFRGAVRGRPQAERSHDR
ncbi:MAG: hypothetical protein A4E60_02939 [Syntrophorhabdus sp. PtaB.Bin047]|nr:MAG: hypothetical protein A4E60_02939 [Syntrophorhabdus sp. PtaB.Bin047]